MDNLLEMILCMFFVLGELAVALSISFFIQIIVYGLTGFNIFDNILKLLDKFENYIDKKLS